MFSKFFDFRLQYLIFFCKAMAVYMVSRVPNIYTTYLFTEQLWSKSLKLSV